MQCLDPIRDIVFYPSQGSPLSSWGRLIMLCETQARAVSCALDSAMDSTDAQTYMAQQCSEGYYGPLCSMCLRHDRNGHSYGRTNIWSCQRCRHKATILVAYIASFLLVLLFLAYTVQVTLQENSEPWPNDHTTASSLLRVWGAPALCVLETAGLSNTFSTQECVHHLSTDCNPEPISTLGRSLAKGTYMLVWPQLWHAQFVTSLSRSLVQLSSTQNCSMMHHKGLSLHVSMVVEDTLPAMHCLCGSALLNVCACVSVAGGDSLAAVHDHLGQHQPWSSPHCAMGVQCSKFCLFVNHQWQPFIGLPDHSRAAAASPQKPAGALGSAPDQFDAADGAATPVVWLQSMLSAHCLCVGDATCIHSLKLSVCLPVSVCVCV